MYSCWSLEIVRFDLEYVDGSVVPVFEVVIDMLLDSELPYVLSLHGPQQLLSVLLVGKCRFQRHRLPYLALLVHERLGTLYFPILYDSACGPSVLFEESLLRLHQLDRTWRLSHLHRFLHLVLVEGRQG